VEPFVESSEICTTLCKEMFYAVDTKSTAWCVKGIVARIVNVAQPHITNLHNLE